MRGPTGFSARGEMERKALESSQEDMAEALTLWAQALKDVSDPDRPLVEAIRALGLEVRACTLMVCAAIYSGEPG